MYEEPYTVLNKENQSNTEEADATCINECVDIYEKDRNSENTHVNSMVKNETQYVYSS